MQSRYKRLRNFSIGGISINGVDTCVLLYAIIQSLMQLTAKVRNVLNSQLEQMMTSTYALYLKTIHEANFEVVAETMLEYACMSKLKTLTRFVPDFLFK